MGGQILDYEAKDIYQSGVKEGLKTGSNQKLVELITKKLLKGKTTFEIAEDLEEPEENIQQLILEYNLMEKIAE